MRLNIRAKELGDNAQLAVRRAALAMDNELVSRTPFDTGRAKGNWITAIGSPDNRRLAVGGPAAGQAALDQGRSKIGKWKLGMGPIYITNNLVYIVPLNNGSSEQAPTGMTDFALQAAKREIKKVRLLK